MLGPSWVNRVTHSLLISSKLSLPCLRMSATTVIFKVFENVIFDQLSEYFVTNNLFPPQQYGFRKL